MAARNRIETLVIGAQHGVRKRGEQSTMRNVAVAFGGPVSKLRSYPSPFALLLSRSKVACDVVQ